MQHQYFSRIIKNTQVCVVLRKNISKKIGQKYFAVKQRRIIVSNYTFEFHTFNLTKCMKNSLQKQPLANLLMEYMLTTITAEQWNPEKQT